MRDSINNLTFGVSLCTTASYSIGYDSKCKQKVFIAFECYLTKVYMWFSTKTSGSSQSVTETFQQKGAKCAVQFSMSSISHKHPSREFRLLQKWEKHDMHYHCMVSSQTLQPKGGQRVWLSVFLSQKIQYSKHRSNNWFPTIQRFCGVCLVVGNKLNISSFVQSAALLLCKEKDNTNRGLVWMRDPSSLGID